MDKRKKIWTIDIKEYDFAILENNIEIADVSCSNVSFLDDICDKLNAYEAAIALLGKIQWHNDIGLSDGYYLLCPCCRRNKEVGHTEDCKLYNLIKEYDNGRNNTHN